MGEIQQVAKEQTGPNTEVVVERYVSNGRGGRGNLSGLRSLFEAFSTDFRQENLRRSRSSRIASMRMATDVGAVASGLPNRVVAGAHQS